MSGDTIREARVQEVCDEYWATREAGQTETAAVGMLARALAGEAAAKDKQIEELSGWVEAVRRAAEVAPISQDALIEGATKALAGVDRPA